MPSRAIRTPAKSVTVGLDEQRRLRLALALKSASAARSSSATVATPATVAAAATPATADVGCNASACCPPTTFAWEDPVWWGLDNDPQAYVFRKIRSTRGCTA